jgi:hypothetical protein
MLRNAIWDVATLFIIFELERESFLISFHTPMGVGFWLTFTFFLWFFELGEGSDRCDKSGLIVIWNGYWPLTWHFPFYFFINKIDK